MSMSPSQLGVFARSSPDVAAARRRVPRAAAVAAEVRRPAAHVRRLHRERVQPAAHVARQHSCAASPDPAAPPVIAPNYLSTDEDRRVAAASLRLTRRIARAPALAKYAPDELLPGAALTSDEDLARAAGDIGTTIFHPVGTCRMGDGGRSAAPWSMRACACTASRDCASPTRRSCRSITSGNTNSPTLMIAERAVRHDPRGSAAASARDVGRDDAERDVHHARAEQRHVAAPAVVARVAVVEAVDALDPRASFVVAPQADAVERDGVVEEKEALRAARGPDRRVARLRAREGSTTGTNPPRRAPRRPRPRASASVPRSARALRRSGYFALCTLT